MHELQRRRTALDGDGALDLSLHIFRQKVEEIHREDFFSRCRRAELLFSDLRVETTMNNEDSKLISFLCSGSRMFCACSMKLTKDMFILPFMTFFFGL